MKNAIKLIAAAGFATVGFASVASAGTGGTFTLSVVGAPATVDTTAGDVVLTFDVTGDATVGTHILGGSYYLRSDSAFVTAMQWTNPSWSAFPTDPGYQGNGNYGQVIFGQLVIVGVPPFDVAAPGSELGGSLGSWQVTIAQGSIGTLDLRIDLGLPFSLETIDMTTGASYQNIDGVTVSNGASINLVPAPSAMALLGLGGLVAGRRRR